MGDFSSSTNPLYDFRAEHQTDPDLVAEHLNNLETQNAGLFKYIDIDGVKHAPEIANTLTVAANIFDIAEEMDKAFTLTNVPFFLEINKDRSNPLHHLCEILVLDTLYRKPLPFPFSVSQELSSAQHLEELLGAVEANVNRQLSKKEAGILIQHIVKDGLLFDKQFMETSDQIPFISTKVMPTFFDYLAKRDIKVHPTGAPIVRFPQSKTNGAETAAYIDTRNPTVHAIITSSDFKESWRHKLENIEVIDGVPAIEFDSEIGQAINNKHCVFGAVSLFGATKKGVIHTSSHNPFAPAGNTNGSLLKYADEAGFNVRTITLTDQPATPSANRRHRHITLSCRQKFSHEIKGNVTEDRLNTRAYGAEMEFAKESLFLTGLDHLFEQPPTKEVGFGIDEWAKIIADKYFGGTTPIHGLN